MPSTVGHCAFAGLLAAGLVGEVPIVTSAFVLGVRLYEER